MTEFERYEQLSAFVEEMNAQAMNQWDIPYLRLHDYLHYCDVKTFLLAYTRRLRLKESETQDLLAFCFRDTLELKNGLGNVDLYAFTYHYFRKMCYRTGNLDTPDDCVEKLDLERFGAYRQAREKQWRGEGLSDEERAILDRTVKDALMSLKLPLQVCEGSR